MRLWVNGQLLIDRWVSQSSPTTYPGSIALKAQQLYNLEMDYFQGTGGAVATLAWRSPSTPQAIIPQTQLYAYTNPPPTVVLSSPTNNSGYSGSASVTLGAEADAPYNPVAAVNFYASGAFLGSVSNRPFTLTATGLAPGNYAMTAVAVDGSGLSSTSAPIALAVAPGNEPYGLTNNGAVPAFFNMPPTFNGSLPALLSQTGVFTNTPAMIPATGLIPYQPNVPLWSDGALKIRYLAVPNNGGPVTPDKQIGFAPNGSWTFPAGTVFVKTFALQTNQMDSNSILRLETRLLVRDINGQVYGVTYKWRPDNSDAELLTTGSNQPVTIITPAGTQTQTWYYPSPADCLTCHTPVANYVLGVNARQLNGALAYPSTRVTDNQLRTLNRLGIFNPAFDEAAIAGYERLSALTNLNASLEERARSYLDANCAQCHQPGGTGPTFDARYETPLAAQNITNMAVIGNLGYDHAHVVTAKDVWRSVLYDRMNSTNAGVKMPQLARNLIDSNAVAVIADWINSLPGTPALAPPAITPNGGSFTGPVHVIIQPPDAQAAIYYTLDGSAPTTNALRYSAPFDLAHSATVKAAAFEAGSNDSVAVSATFTIQSLAFTSMGFTDGTVFRMEFSGSLDGTYVLQATTNLIDWTPLTTNLATVNGIDLLDSNAGSYAHRYYRMLRQ